MGSKMKKLYALLIAATLATVAAAAPQLTDNGAHKTTSEEVGGVQTVAAEEQQDGSQQQQQSTPEELWHRGNTLYAAGDYNGALVAYDSIAAQHLVSSKLYYNIANAYFKAGNIGEAILYYHKAEKLAPNDGDIAYNLAYANSFVKDKIEAVPEFVGRRAARSVGDLLSPNGWGVVSIVMLALWLVAGVWLVVARKRKIRKMAFALAVVLSVLTLGTMAIGGAEKQQQKNENQGIVLWSAAAVKASPDRTSKDLFILHEGTKVELVGEYGSWVEVRIADGNKGWMSSEAIGVI